METYPVHQGTEMLEAPQVTHHQKSKMNKLIHSKNMVSDKKPPPTFLDPVEKQQPHE